MDIRKVRALIELVQESGVAELEIKEGEETVRISRIAQGGVVMCGPLPQMPMMPAGGSAPVESGKGDAVPATQAKINGHIVRSRMVGSIYRSPSTDAKHFIEIGQRF